MYALCALDDDLWQITLPAPGLPAPLGTPVNVYALLGPAPALVGAGHPRSWPALEAALARLSLRPRDITRVVATDWSPAQLGAIDRLPRADLFLLSPDLDAPARYRDHLQQERAWLERAAAELLEHPDYAAVMRLDALQRALDDWTRDLPARLDFAPLREGHALRLGRRLLRALDAPGPHPGHLLLWDEPHRLLFSGRLATEPAFGDLSLREASLTLQSIERAFDLQPARCLPTLGRAAEDGLQHLRRANKHLVNVLGHLPFLLQGNLTLPDVLRRDMGHIPAHLPRYLETLRFYQACFDELVRGGATRKQGHGVWARYGAGAPDPRLAPG
jgi:glyoxylase-like metal-dependent hydrolase (beta-lactamase superfamily II)